ncbi:MAG: type II toxin-antitoxin system VapB family antitoxin [Desulfohalobiaceae bacterium]|nr:type II toxin-antitoxin system VapB family antitoxin [Desulfohalobiaceae bacterium]
MEKAKVFWNGRSQAVRLPAEFRFDTSEVFIRRDPDTNEVILSPRPTTWYSFLELRDKTRVPEDFLSEGERGQDPGGRDPFEDGS